MPATPMSSSRWWTGREIRARWRIATDPRRTADEYAVWLNQLLMLEGYALRMSTGVIIGTVVPRALHNLQVLAANISRPTR
jgi:type III pantothenate kinase